MTVTQQRWRAVRQPSDTADTDLIDCEVVEAFDRYATRATAWFEDPDGTKEATYSRGQRVELDYSVDGGTSWTRRFAGVVITPTPVYDAGAQALKVEVYGYDHFLRRQGVYESYTGANLSTVIEDIITDYTPVTYSSGNVDIVNDTTITREFRGEKVDSCIKYLLSLSADEEFGVDRDFNFFIRERQVSRSPIDIDDSGYFDYDLPTEGAAAVNFVRLFYGTTSPGFITVEDRVSQRDLKDSLNAPRNVVISAEATYPEIEDQDAARAKAEEILANRVPLRTGIVRSFGRYLMSAGDVFRLTIEAAGIDTDYRVAQIAYRWRTGETTVTVAENRGDVSALLVELSDEVSRIDARDADPDSVGHKYLTFTLGAKVTASGSAAQSTTSSESFDPGAISGAETLSPFDPTSTPGFTLGTSTSVDVAEAAVTTAAVNQFRDVWQGATPTSITHVAIGSGSKPVSQADTELDTELGRVAVDGVVASGSYAIDLTGTIAAGGQFEGETIREFGFFDASSGGNMYLRCVLDEPVVHSPAVDLDLAATMTVTNDASKVGIITNTGRTELRDLFLGDSTDAPDTMRIGTGTTAESATDTALATFLDSKTITQADTVTGETTNEASLTTGENNASDLSEAGLTYDDADDDLYARVVWQPLTKTADFDLTLDMRLLITGVPTIS